MASASVASFVDDDVVVVVVGTGEVDVVLRGDMRPAKGAVAPGFSDGKRGSVRLAANPFRVELK